MRIEQWIFNDDSFLNLWMDKIALKTFYIELKKTELAEIS